MDTPVLRILIRTTGLVGLEQAFVHLVRFDGDDGLGVGLLAFAATALAALLWGGYDGWRQPFGRVAVVWVVTAVLYGAATAALIQVPPQDGVDWGVLASDLALVAPFSAQLVLVPALVGAALGQLRPSRDARQSHLS